MGYRSFSEPTPSKATRVEMTITESEINECVKRAEGIASAKPLNGHNYTNDDVRRLAEDANYIVIWLRRIQRRRG